MGIGARLKEAREAKELSLDELQDITKIQKRYLVAIEEENFSILPGKFYAKAFIKEYAIAVGVDPNQLMEEYKEEIPSPEEDTTTQYTRIHRSRKDNMPTRSSAIFSFIPTLIVVLLIIGIVFLAWWFLTKSNDNEDPSPVDETGDNTIIRNEDTDTSGEETKDENGAKDPDPDSEDTSEDEQDGEGGSGEETNEDQVEEETELSMNVVEQGSGSPPVSTIELSNTGEALMFTFESESGVWLDVKNEAGESFFGAITDPENSPMEIDLTGQEKIFLNIGHAPDLSIKINGVDVEYPVDPNTSDHQQIWFNVTEENE
jgi:cytoskeletal protein RodZ